LTIPGRKAQQAPRPYKTAVFKEAGQAELVFPKTEVLEQPQVIPFIAGDSEGGSDKQVLLKQLAKEISQNKYAKFYRVRQEEADSSPANYFYSVYKIVHPAVVFLRDPALAAGTYRVRIVTQYSNDSRALKAPHIFTFDKPLTVSSTGVRPGRRLAVRG
jgi:hypothetical protein